MGKKKMSDAEIDAEINAAIGINIAKLEEDAVFKEILEVLKNKDKDGNNTSFYDENFIKKFDLARIIIKYASDLSYDYFGFLSRQLFDKKVSLACRLKLSFSSSYSDSSDCSDFDFINYVNKIEGEHDEIFGIIIDRMKSMNKIYLDACMQMLERNGLINTAIQVKDHLIKSPYWEFLGIVGKGVNVLRRPSEISSRLT